jgi:HB1, ASXL, restriction endonuclease HTH domain
MSRSVDRAQTAGLQIDDMGNVPPQRGAASGLTYFEAALTILSSAESPLTTRQITEHALRQGLITTRGRTPEATMSAALYRKLGTDDKLVKIDVRAQKRAGHGTVRWAITAKKMKRPKPARMDNK